MLFMVQKESDFYTKRKLMHASDSEKYKINNSSVVFR